MTVDLGLSGTFLAAGWKKVKAERAIGYQKTFETTQTLTVEISTTTLPDKQRIDLFWYLEFAPFTKVVEKVFAPKVKSKTILFRHAEHHYVAFGQKPDATQIINAVHDWRETCHPLDFITDLANGHIPPNGQLQIFHLAALAITGNFNTLMDYQSIFIKGQRLNFVPMITRPVIERALDIALENA